MSWDIVLFNSKKKVETFFREGYNRKFKSLHNQWPSTKNYMLWTGNSGTKVIGQLMVKHKEVITDFLKDISFKEIACLELEK